MSKEVEPLETHNINVKGAWVKHGNDFTYPAAEFVKKGHWGLLQREPHNPHDENAILILIKNRKLGHIPKEISLKIANRLDSGEIEGRVEITEVQRYWTDNDVEKIDHVWGKLEIFKTGTMPEVPKKKQEPSQLKGCLVVLFVFSLIFFGAVILASF